MTEEPTRGVLSEPAAPRPSRGPPRPGRSFPEADRLLVVFSDIEMGTGGPLDDFPHSDFLGSLILGYNQGPLATLPVELVFNGDTFDLFKTPFEGAFPRLITREIALGKLEAILAAHPAFCAAIQEFVAHPGAERRVHFVAGNHDAELAFPAVQERVRARCGGGPRIGFPGLELRVGRVHIEHGSQHDPLFRMNPEELLLDVEGEPVLNISWGAAALLDTLMPLKELLYFHDRLKPKSVVLKLLPEIRELMLERFWSYWLRDFWKGYIGGLDPTQRLTWGMLKEIAWRFGSKNPDVMPGDELARRLALEDDVLLYVVGHKHQAAWTSHGDRKILQSGCLRNEYMLLPGGGLRPMPKSYVEAYLRDGRPIVSELVEVEGPPPPEGYVPASIFDVLPALRGLATSGAERESALAARTAEEERERRRGGVDG
jgi:hypothetical protein